MKGVKRSVENEMCFVVKRFYCAGETEVNKERDFKIVWPFRSMTREILLLLIYKKKNI